MFNQPVSKTYVWGTLGWILGFTFSVIAVGHYTEAMEPGSPQRIALALAPLVMLPFAFRLDFDFYDKLDEMQRRIMLESALLGIYAVTASCAVGLMLEELGGLPRMSPLWVLGVAGASWLLGWLYISRKYR